MELLFRARPCTLYDLDFTMIAAAKYAERNVEEFTIFFKIPLKQPLPKEFYLKEDDTNNFICYQCTASNTTPCEIKIDSTDRVTYVVEALAKDNPTSREELRVNTSIKVQAKIEGLEESENITIKNISAGGIMFVSKKKLEQGTVVSFDLDIIKMVIPIHATIVKVQPADEPETYSYGCKFEKLVRQTETAIRNYVFMEDLRSKRAGLRDL